MDRLSISCRYTGIVGSIDLPVVEGRNACLHYTHPLSHIDSVIEVVDEGLKYMRRLEPTVLAGMYITILRYVGALRTKEDAAYINNELSKAGKGALLHCTKALSSYVVPLAKVNKKIGMAKIGFSVPFKSAHDARLWLGSATETLLQECLEVDSLEKYIKGLVHATPNTQYVSPYAYAAKEDMKAALAQRELVKEQLANDQYFKAEALRAKKKERAITVTGSNYAAADLFYNETIDGCVVELHIAANEVASDKIAARLCATFARERAKKVQHIVPAHTNTTLITIAKTLDTMACGKLELLLAKLREHEYATELCNLTRIVELLIINMQSVKSSVTILEDLGSAIKTEGLAKPLSLRERLASFKGAKEINNAN